ncbi:YggS family pyridoxal phosphate enzyme [Snodgrassella alvi]|uniref:YggS family pyridoxal phosphate-dependent enzyme n=1 Tax=Snodgrassella alvi TaxID=1196083 RepID=UPI000A00CA15|nr:YggS family pyridoxal phosphate-dependent enzyme [Snodgrassella alvi]ORF26047.1 YggS family pyridoxal phosphate enzyme [Snodgrassella alvi]ORF29598.1 YggS family pyridoxal phosphate enzyme [Snodgrassella alvi]ORF35177.1 YggS family pyridoxal phosphate enzyme [Snodgrassella alvi]ORF40987.1 YggS family pyridoxal phosphate enzyme [Snodgrassella alvi]ORF41585.1 YggS family pyridoxal phosphate enzyme [Snodgrassella alvi]
MKNTDILIQHWQQVLANINDVCRQTAAPQPVQLIAVSKTFPANDIITLYEAGQRDFGENYIQEFSEKTSQFAELDIVWHMIGHIQSNKSRIVAERAHWVHTIDREKIARRLHEQRPEYLPPLNVCIEVNISAESNKHGISPNKSELLTLANMISELPRLKLRGLMCVAKTGSTDTELQQQFHQMQNLLQYLHQAGFAVDVLSMGMSADLSIAIACGATHVRVGSAIFGQRNYTQTENNS